MPFRQYLPFYFFIVLVMLIVDANLQHEGLLPCKESSILLS